MQEFPKMRHLFGILRLFIVLNHIFCHLHVSTLAEFQSSYWEKKITLKNWPRFHNDFCGRECVHGMLTVKLSECSNPFCFPCTCNEDCTIKGTCCPTDEWANMDFLANLTTGRKYNEVFGLFERLSCYDMSPYNLEYCIAIRTCPTTWKDPKLRSSCEDNTYDKLEYKIPFVNTKTHFYFKNIFCVQCNGFEFNSTWYLQSSNPFEMNGLKPVAIGLDCSGFMDLTKYSHFTDRYEILNAILPLSSSHTVCSTRTFEFFQRCETPSHVSPEKYLDSCPNVTGNIIKDLCHNLPDIPALRVHKAKNIFCYLCNDAIDVYPSKNCQTPRRNQVYDDIYFFQQFPFQSQENKKTEEKENCLSHPITNMQDQCTLVSCAPGKLYRNDNESCETAIKWIRNLLYVIYLVFVPETTIDSFLFVEIGTFLNLGFKDILKDWFQFHYLYESKECSNETGRHERMQHIRVILTISSTRKTQRDNFENETLNIITQSRVSVTVNDSSNGTREIRLRLACLGPDQCEFYQRESGFYECRVIETAQLGNHFVHSNFIRNKDTTIPLTPILACPYVSPNLISKPFVADGVIIFPIKIQQWTIKITDVTSIHYEDGKFHVCLNHFKKILNQRDEISLEDSAHLINVPDLRYTVGVLIALVFASL